MFQCCMQSLCSYYQPILSTDGNHYFDEKKPSKVRVLYLADSNHQWKYGHPFDFDFSKIDTADFYSLPKILAN